MDKKSIPCAWGDCPGLDYSPKSREHENRFVSRSRVEGQMIKTEAAAMINSDNERNHAI